MWPDHDAAPADPRYPPWKRAQGHTKTDEPRAWAMRAEVTAGLAVLRGKAKPEDQALIGRSETGWRTAPGTARR